MGPAASGEPPHCTPGFARISPPIGALSSRQRLGAVRHHSNDEQVLFIELNVFTVWLLKTQIN